MVYIDTIAVLLAIACVGARLFGRPYLSTLLASTAVLASVVAGWVSHYRHCRQDLAEARRAGRPVP